MKAPEPTNEEARLKALHQYDILDTVPEQAFDDLTLLAAHICQVPKAMVSLVDQDRQWFKSKIGVPQQETSRDIAFCAHTILHADKVLQVRDATTDIRFADSPLVTEDHIRFYAGAPLVNPAGFSLGALCVMDTAPRELSPGQLAALQALSRRVVDQLELRSQARELAKKEHETARLLVQAEKSRRALLSVLEDEKRSGQSLRESETRFRQMAENIDEVFWMFDPVQNQMLYVSPAYERIWGRPSKELYGNPAIWWDAIVPDDQPRVMLAKEKLASGKYLELYRIERPDGTLRWIDDRAFPVRDASGQVYRIVGVAVDVTERKQLEEQFLRAQRMEAIGTLAGGVAHDLNNILAPVMMISSILKEKLPDPADRQALSMVETSAQRGAAIIRQLLMFSRGVTGERVIVQLRHLVKEMVTLMRETFPRDIAIVEDVATNLWPVTGDPTQLHQVLMNLCVNGRDAMPDGGQMTVRAENVHLTEADVQGRDGAQPGPYVRLTVEDTGQGIPPEVIGRIFDPFFTTKEVGKGTGLGLSTVMGIVTNHRGFVTVQTEVGKGTAFRVHVPAESTGIVGVVEAPSTPLRGDGEVILVVDDEPHVRQATELMLQANNYRTVRAANGREALARLLENPTAIKLVVTDLMMPVMNGIELTRALRKSLPAVKIVATTGLDQDGKKEQLTALGVTEILIKPCTPPALLGAIRRMLDQP